MEHLHFVGGLAGDADALRIMTTQLGSRALVGLAALLSPVLAGAIIYYSLRRNQTDLAHFGNRMSFAGFVLWSVGISTGRVPLDGTAVHLVTAFLGIVLAIVAVWRFKQTALLLRGPASASPLGPGSSRNEPAGLPPQPNVP